MSRSDEGRFQWEPRPHTLTRRQMLGALAAPALAVTPEADDDEASEADEADATWDSASYGVDGDELAEMIVSLTYRLFELLNLWAPELETERTGPYFSDDAEHLAWFLHAVAMSMHCNMVPSPRTRGVWALQIPEAVRIGRFALALRMKGGAA